MYSRAKTASLNYTEHRSRNSPLTTMLTIWTITLLGLASVTISSVSHSERQHGSDRTDNENTNGYTIVQMFEWPYMAIARECEQFLGRVGYWAVQISPAQECAVVDGRPWWERYQPVSYRISSRSGSQRQLREMVRVCRRHGVHVFADVVLNHMTGGQAGRGSAGTPYNGTAEIYHGQPGYTPANFNDPKCRSDDGNIHNYGSAEEVKNCRLNGLRDLDQSQPHVRRSIVRYMKRLMALGVTGFRIDAAKHMWPADLKPIIGSLKLPRRWRRISSRQDRWRSWRETLVRPVVYQEVIDHGGSGEAVHALDYTQLGRVTEFRHCDHISKLVRREDQLAYTRTWGPSWAMLDSRYALVFVDNHDNQRTDSVVTHREPRLYRLAQALVLARPYGLVRIISSYRFNTSDQGPPSDPATGRIRPARVDPTSGQCTGGDWVCEHRWPALAAMATLRRVAGSQPLTNWWTNGDQQIAYARHRRAFIAFNNQPGQSLRQHLNTTLPRGRYCDVITGQRDITHESCTGRVVVVEADGTADIEISADADETVLAIHIQQRLLVDGE